MIILVTVAAVEMMRTKPRVNEQVTRNAYDQIVKGMSMAEVRYLLGNSTSDEVGTRSTDNYYANSTKKNYVGPTATIVLHVQKGVVLDKQWIDKETLTVAMSDSGDSSLQLPPPPPQLMPPPPPPPPPPSDSQ